MKTYIVHTDGGARGNPGPAAVGVSINDPDKKTYTVSRYIGTATNNVAEYQGVIAALDLLVTLPHGRQTIIIIHLDSQLVTRQLNGLYRVKDSELKKLFEKVKELEKKLNCTIQYNEVPRTQNRHADLLVNQALDALPGRF